VDGSLKRTPLYQWHQDHGARLVEFVGWEMPVFYPTGAVLEHQVTRRSAGLFDIDHMGQFTVTGRDATAFLNRLVTSDMASLAVDQSRYGLLCRENGGVVDDVFVYRRAEDFLVVVNASNREKDLAWLNAHIAGFHVDVTDVSDELCMLALQGPCAFELLAGINSLTRAPQLDGTQLDGLPRFCARNVVLAGVSVYLGRTGYTGEDGVELFFAADKALTLWNALLDGGAAQGLEVLPVGLAARDSLRFEPGFPLYGHEIGETITPLEANLNWALDWSKPFVGREALAAQKVAGLTRKLVALELTEPGVLRQGYPVTNAEGHELGPVVSGLFAPTVGKSVGHAFVPPALAVPGTPLFVTIRDQKKTAQVVKRPLVRPRYKEST